MRKYISAAAEARYGNKALVFALETGPSEMCRRRLQHGCREAIPPPKIKCFYLTYKEKKSVLIRRKDRKSKQVQQEAHKRKQKNSQKQQLMMQEI